MNLEQIRALIVVETGPDCGSWQYPASSDCLDRREAEQIFLSKVRTARKRGRHDKDVTPRRGDVFGMLSMAGIRLANSKTT